MFFDGEAEQALPQATVISAFGQMMPTFRYETLPLRGMGKDETVWQANLTSALDA